MTLPKGTTSLGAAISRMNPTKNPRLRSFPLPIRNHQLNSVTMSETPTHSDTEDYSRRGTCAEPGEEKHKCERLCNHTESIIETLKTRSASSNKFQVLVSRYHTHTTFSQKQCTNDRSHPSLLLMYRTRSGRGVKKRLPLPWLEAQRRRRRHPNFAQISMLLS